jgi:hypothetical protein
MNPHFWLAELADLLRQAAIPDDRAVFEDVRRLDAAIREIETETGDEWPRELTKPIFGSRELRFSLGRMKNLANARWDYHFCKPAIKVVHESALRIIHALESENLCPTPPSLPPELRKPRRA